MIVYTYENDPKSDTILLISDHWSISPDTVVAAKITDDPAGSGTYRLMNMPAEPTMWERDKEDQLKHFASHILAEE